MKFSSRRFFPGLAALAVTAGILSLTHGGTSHTATASPGRDKADVPIVLTAHVITDASASYSSYTVRSGDTLSGISRKEYGSAGCWPGIWGANTGKISNPNLIYTGQEFSIPSACSTQGPAMQTASTVGGTSPVGQGGDSNPGVQQKFTPPPPAPVTGGFYDTVLSYAQLEALWVAGGGPAWAESHAAEIAECESGGNRYAYNPSGATGLWQILGQVTDFGGSLTDPWVNVHNAVAKFNASGQTFAQWVCT